MAANITLPIIFANLTGTNPASDFDSNFNELVSAANNPVTYSNYLVDSGTANVYAGSFTPAITQYTAGLGVQMKIGNTNTGASTLNLNSLGTKAITYQNGAALVGGELQAGMVAQFFYDGASFQFVSQPKLLNAMATITESYATNTGPGAASSGLNTRALNTIQYNGITGLSVASSAVSLPAGSYWFDGSAPAYGYSTINSHQLILYNNTSSALALTGTAEYSYLGTSQTRSRVSGLLTFSVTTSLSLKHWFSGAQATDGQGVTSNSGYDNIFATLDIIKVN